MKKGYFFSLFVVTALSIMIMTYKTSTDFKEQKTAEIYKNRVGQTNLFVSDLEEDVSRALYISAYRALLGIDEYIHMNQTYVQGNPRDRIIELIINGTYNGVVMNATNASTFGDWIKTMQNLANQYHLRISYPDMRVQTRMITPFEVQITFLSNASFESLNDDISWNFSISKEAIIDLGEAGFSDPLYFIEGLNNYEKNAETNGSRPLTNSIKRSPYGLNTLWINKSSSGIIAYDVSNLTDHVHLQYYFHSNISPSYFMRLAGKTDCEDPLYKTECRLYGIESFVNVLNSSSVWLYSADGVKTCAIDYQFLVSGCNDPMRVIGMNDRFVIDSDDAIFYNLTGLNQTS